MNGAHFTTRDPEGNFVYFDTMEDEEGLRPRVEILLRDLEARLAALGLSSDSLVALRD